MKDYSEMKGWQGEDLPDGVLGLIIIRKFAAACAVMAGNFQKTYEEAVQLLNGCEAHEVGSRLDKHPFFRGVMERMADVLEDPDLVSNQYRLDAKTLFDQVRGLNTDTIITLCYALWVTDGADLPEGLIEVVKKVEEGDDEDVIADLTGDEEE